MGAIDDLWKFGKPRGIGGPWKDSEVSRDVPSDPYLIHGYRKKTLLLKHETAEEVGITIEIDITGQGDWVQYLAVSLDSTQEFRHEFPEGFDAYWIRFLANRDVSSITAELKYE